MLRKREVLFINIAAGLIAGTLLGIGEILYREISTKVKGTALAQEAETVVKDTAPDGTGN